MAIRVYRSLADMPRRPQPSAVTIGNFDGVHCGHRVLLDRIVRQGAASSRVPTVLTFDPHPARVLAPPDRAPRLLTTHDQRTAIMGALGIEQELILPFTLETAQMSPREFVEQILVHTLASRVVVVGDNFRFGHKQAGDIAALRTLGEEFGFEVITAGAVAVRRRVVSSTEIRNALANGAVSLARRLLGRPYTLEGVVVPGRGVGSTQTVPTLNLATEAEVLPASGVYVTRTSDRASGRTWPSITNIGYRPTFGDTGELSIETFLLSALDGPRPDRICLEFLRRVRGEKKFESAADLKAQILIDAARASAYHRRNARWVRIGDVIAQ